ncbi:uncharacterized protein LOC109600229 isoform X2 [Aethina tumida]|uniref:uncharacterized protein LOC109600229 isoform X2 n=1 Tax=Aethina tumida TaxID=116153 RepID=UPI0021487304|nr:uncharacterized protein LOC109600229 isoform X2 [Aethina tumida]
MRISCAAKYCKNKSYNCNLKFFNFPMEARAQIWLIACGREDLLHKGVNLFKYKICSAHFEKKHFNVYRLKSDAVPTLFPTMESSSLAEHSYCQAINDSNNVQGIPKNCKLRSSSLNDHSYCRASPELDCNTGQGKF